jgi:hypothetical protein
MGDHLLGPLIPYSSPFPLYITDSQSGFSPEWLKINRDHVLEQFYDIALRSDSTLQPTRVYKDATKLTVLDEYDGSSIDISLNRTLRVPEDGTVYDHPALFGPFPLLNVDLLQDKLPDLMARKSGLLIPMFSREALSIGFKTDSLRSVKNVFNQSQRNNQSFAIKILAGSVNTISGGLEEGHGRSRQREKQQDYVVAPRQGRVDGFFAKAGANIVRQFVAMPVFSGYAAESQLKGEDNFGGIQLAIAPRFAGRGEFRMEPYGEDPLDHSQQKLSPRELGLQPGHVLFVSGEELAQRFRNALCTDKDALCTGPDFFIQGPRIRFFCFDDPLPKSPHPSTERPALVHELLAILEEEIGSGEPLLLEPVFRMTITIESCHSSKFSNARMDMYKGMYPPSLGFGFRIERDYRHDRNPISLTWRVSPFMSLQQLFHLVRVEFDADEIALFRRREQIEDREYTALHCILEDEAVISCQAYKITQGHLHGIDSPPREEVSQVPRVSPWEMGLALGGKIYQDICTDPQPEWWNWERSQFINIQILNAVAFKSFTGFKEALRPPLSFRQYVNARMPFFHLISQSEIVGSEVLAKLKTVGEKDLESGVNQNCQLDGVTPTGCIICERNLANTM